MNLIELLKTYPKHSQPRPSGMTYGGPPPGVGSPPPSQQSTTVGTPAQQSTPSGNATQQTNPNPIVENLITSGGEYQLTDGTEYIGPYHIHPSQGPMVGATHDRSNHPQLFPLITTGNTGVPTVVTNSPSRKPNNVSPVGAPLPGIPNVPESIQQEYIDNGLTFKSNNQYVTDRDAAGNIKFQISGSDNQNLVIEPAIENFTNSSFVNAIDTQFNYFKFPASIKAGDIPESTIAEINFNLGLADGITARYVVPYEERDNGDPISFKRLNINQDTGKFKSDNEMYNNGQNANYWYSGDDGVAVRKWEKDKEIATDERGKIRLTANSLKKIPFKQKIDGGGDQIEPGTFTLTQEMIDTLRENNQTIKFRIRMQITRPSFTGLYKDNGGLGYYSYGLDWDGEATMRLERTMPTQFRTFIKPEDTVNGMTAYTPFAELQLDYIIDIKNDAFEFDKYFIKAGGAVVDNLVDNTGVNEGTASVFYGMTYNRDVSYWEVLVIDDPGGNYGDQNI